MRAFVLSGGAFRGAFQVGVLLQLHEKNIFPDVIYGTSIGAINAIGYSYRGIHGLHNLWSSIKSRRDVFDFPSPFWRLFTSGILSSRPLRKLVQETLTHSWTIPVFVCYTNLGTGEVHYQSQLCTDSPISFEDAVIASCSLPGIVEPVHGIWVDGGVRELTPLERASTPGVKEIIVILNNCLELEAESTYPSLLSRFFRAFSILTHEVFINDLVSFHRLKKEMPMIALTVFAPERPLYPSLEFSPSKIQEAIKLGYEAKPLSAIQLQECIQQHLSQYGDENILI